MASIGAHKGLILKYSIILTTILHYGIAVVMLRLVAKEENKLINAPVLFAIRRFGNNFYFD